VAGARITVRDATTRSVVASGVTDSAGEFFLGQLPEAYYDLEVTADRHAPYRGAHLVLAGQLNDVQAFVSYQTVHTPGPWSNRNRGPLPDHHETTFETVVPSQSLPSNPR